MKSQLQLITATIALTVLIWFYADQAGHESYSRPIAIQLKVPAAAGGLIRLRVHDPSQSEPGSDVVRADIAVSGPQSGITRFREMTTADRLSPTVYVKNLPPTGETRRLDLYTELSRDPELQRLGLTLISVTPDDVEYEAVRYRELPVELDLRAGAYENDLQGEPTYDPPRLIARVPESLLGAGSTLAPVLVLLEERIHEALEQRGMQEGPLTFEVPLNPTSIGPGVELKPDRIQVRLELRMQSRPMTKAPIPLRISVPFADASKSSKFEIVLDDEGDLTRIIEVLVPLQLTEAFDRLEGKDIEANILMDASDLPASSAGTVLKRRIRFRLPDGFEECRITSAPQDVNIRILPTPAAGDAPSPPPAP